MAGRRFLIGLSTFQAEFDFGVPQFGFLFAPMLIMFAAAVALVALASGSAAAPRWARSGSSCAIRGAFTAGRRAVLGESTPHFPLYLAEALCVEGPSALLVPRERPLRVRALCGVPDRHGRPRGRVGLVACLDPDPVAGFDAPRGRSSACSPALGGGLVGSARSARAARATRCRPRGARVAFAARRAASSPR